MLPPFRLYGLIGCPHCVTAEQFLRSRECPVITVIANDDPIATAGVEALTGKTEFPVLCYTPEKEILRGFKEVEYDRVVKAYHAAASAGAFNVPAGEQQPVSEGQAAVAQVLAGAS